MSDWLFPKLSSTYVAFVAELDGRLNDAAKQNRSDSAPSNLPTGSIRWNVTSNKWESNIGTAGAPNWTALTSTYDINVNTANTLSTARTIAMTGDATATATSFNGSANISLTSVLANVNATAAIGGTAYGSATSVPVITVNKKGLVTTVGSATLGTIATQASSNVSITGGAISATSITLKQSTTAAPVDEGLMEWDTDNDVLVIGASGATKIFNPSNPASALSSTNQTLSTGCTWNGNTLAVGYGGTGTTTLTGVLYGTGTTAMRAATGAEVATLLSTNNISGNAANVTGTVAIANGGTGSTSLTTITVGTASTANALNTANSYTVAGLTTTSLTVGNSTSSSIIMVDTDEGNRSIHCNSNNIGFLTQAGGWGSYCDDDGNWTAAGNVTAYSDSRLKKDLEVIPYALAKVQSLTGYTYTRTDSGVRQTGLIAQDLQKVLPEAVDTSGEYMSVAYGNIVGLLIEAIKELKAEIEILKGYK